MVTAEYGIRNANHGLLSERPGKFTWPYRQRQNASPLAALEEDIRELRMMMEQVYSEHQSFTTDSVIDISQALDIKINQYMKLTRT